MPGLHRGCTVAKPRTLPVNFPRFTRDHSRTTHGLLPDLPDYPRTTHGLDTDRPGCFKIFKTSGGHQGRPRIAKDRQGSATDELGNCQGSPRIARDRSSGAIRRPIRGSVTGALACQSEKFCQQVSTFPLLHTGSVQPR